MSDLLDYIRDSSLIRKVFDINDTRRVSALICNEGALAAGLEWCRSSLGRDPEFVAESAGVHETTATSIPLSYLAVHPEVNPIVFGPSGRAHAIRLALAGVHNFTFAVDQGYKDYKFDPEYLETNRDNLEKVFGLLQDEPSRRTLASIIRQRISLHHGYLRIAEYPEYEHPFVKAESGDWVMDCGAANGNTSFRFARQVGPRGKVFAFEPDPSNAIKINEALRKETNRDIRATVRVVNAAVGDKAGRLQFESGKGGSSKLSASGDINVEAITLDSFADHQKIVGKGVISFDVEGFEQAALHGGLNFIRRTRPKLQISAYHKMQDLFSLALWVNQNLSGYRLFLGHHDAYHSETDLYAMPT
jgi:FkbM family methyltransferase